MFYIDWTYMVFVLPALLIALWAQFNVKSTFDRYKKIKNNCSITGRDAARSILDANGLNYISIQAIKGELTDHFDPRANVIRLSESVYNSDSVAAVGVAAHEAGHAIQYSVNYTPMKIRSAIIPITNIGSNLAFPLVLLGLVFLYPPLAFAGVILFSFATLFQLVTLPVEFNASSRAVSILENMGSLSQDELQGSKKVLKAAALTYVAALAVSLANLLRLITIANRSKRN